MRCQDGQAIVTLQQREGCIATETFVSQLDSTRPNATFLTYYACEQFPGVYVVCITISATYVFESVASPTTSEPRIKCHHDLFPSTGRSACLTPSIASYP